MTKDEIIRMLHESGYPDYAQEADPRVVAFANLVAAAERRACALVCEDLPAPPDVPRDKATVWDVATLDCAAAIRARGQS